MLTDGLTFAAGSGLNIRMLSEERRGPTFPGFPVAGDLWEITVDSEQYPEGVYEYTTIWTLRTPKANVLSYDVSGTVLGQPESLAKVMFIVAARAFKIQGGFAGSIARALSVSSSQQDFTINVQRTTGLTAVGIMRFGPGMETAIFIPSSNEPITVQRGDAIIIEAPPIVDDYIADISFTLCGFLAV